MSRFSLFLLLSLVLHAAGWLLHGAAQSPGLIGPQPHAAPQVLRLTSVLQEVAPTPVKPPQPPRQQVAPSKAAVAKPVAPLPVARPVSVQAGQPGKTQPAQRLQPKVAGQATPVSASAQAAPTKPLADKPLTEVLSTSPSFRQPPRPPSYPAQARRRNQQGVVLVEVRLDARGQQRSLNVLRSSGVDGLDRAALKAVAQWHFHPETSGGQAVPSRIQIPIQFALTASR